jgi:S-disulfanyl-L-cysteine oxidoreductase SoxD
MGRSRRSRRPGWYWSVVSTALVGLAVMIAPDVGAAAEKTVKDGVYTDAQAKRGRELYDKHCAECHGGNLRGFEYGPALAGSDFLRVWEKKSLADLMDKIQPTMPANAPGSLTRSQAADIMAYMLQAGKFPGGAAELTEDATTLQSIVIAK